MAFLSRAAKEKCSGREASWKKKNKNRRKVDAPRMTELRMKTINNKEMFPGVDLLQKRRRER